MRFWPAIVLAATVLLVTLPSCEKISVLRPLIGTYHLINPSACRGDVQDSTLLVRDDGTYDQVVQLKTGQKETVENGHWTYDRAARRIHFSKFLVSAETSFPTEASHPAVIFVNRSADCWYQHPK